MIRYGSLLCCLALVTACASVRPITGGEKDTQPPALLRALPANRSTNFSAKTILLEFDERVQLERVRDRMLISPPLAERPDVRNAGPRSVEINLNAPLSPNTTYTINLGECVKDLTEGNLTTGLTYVMSTGDDLDSAVVVGSVVNALSGAAEKDMIIGLYAPGDSSGFRRGRPAYMTRSDAAGQFVLANLPNEAFSLFALRDKNANYKYDLPNEEIAFLDAPIHTLVNDSDTTENVLRSFLPASSRQQIRTYTTTLDGALELVMARPTDTVEVRDVLRSSGTLSWTTEYNPTRDTLLLWPSDTTLLAAGGYEVRCHGEILDTLRYRRTKPMPFNMGAVLSGVRDDSTLNVVVRANRPLASIDSTRIQVRMDSVEVIYALHHETSTRSFTATARTPGTSSIEFVLLPKALRDIYGGWNDTLRCTFGIVGDGSTGTMNLTLKGLDQQSGYLLQMFDSQRRLEREATIPAGTTRISWERLQPGMRTLLLISDMNHNGRWDTGEWSTLRQPERTWYHSDPVNVRAAWDVDLEWSIAEP